jgi:hypothetical protein
MKIKLTAQAEQELTVINVKMEETDGEYYSEMSKRERLITDAGLYVDDAYVDNVFNDLDVWCEATGEGETEKIEQYDIYQKMLK